MRWHLEARSAKTTEEFRAILEEFLPEDVLEQVLEHFAPAARQTPLDFGVVPT
jgi:hypothetical protein